jgi:photosystem II stability/assembly factor-like uncharacterized protein
MRMYIIILLCFLFYETDAQTIKLLNTNVQSSFRGLSVVDDHVIWVSGSGGTIGRSVDGGEHWRFITIPGFEKTEFRDIEGFDALTAVAMGIGHPAYILRTIDGGEHWDVVFKDTTTGMFLDAMEFWNQESGIVLGDPVDGRFFIGRTFDGGKTWRGIPTENRPKADSGEACFASSGTNVVKLNKAEAIFISGGFSTHLYIRDERIPIPLIYGKESTGANGIAVKNEKTFLVVGGDFNDPKNPVGNMVLTRNSGKTWEFPPNDSTSGYRSGACYIQKKKWLACGLNGVDMSVDDGKKFRNISSTGFHVCKKAKKGNAVFLAGGKGRIAKLIE